MTGVRLSRPSPRSAWRPLASRRPERIWKNLEGKRAVGGEGPRGERVCTCGSGVGTGSDWGSCCPLPFPESPPSSQHLWLPQTLPSRTGSCGRSALRPAVPRGDRRPVPLPSVDASPETATAPDHRRGVPSHVTRPLCPAHGLGSGTVGETQDSPPTGRCAARTAPAASPRPRVPACRRGRGRVARCLLSAPSPSSKVTGHQTLSWREDDTPWPLCSFPGAAHLGGRGIF